MGNHQERNEKDAIVISKKFAYAALVILAALTLILLLANWNRIVCTKEYKIVNVYGDEIERTIHEYELSGWEVDQDRQHTDTSHFIVIPLRFSRCKQ